MTTRPRFRLPAAALLALGLFAGAAPAERPLHIYFIDVLGGAATLVVTPERESILIDSGWPGQDDRDPKRIVHVLKDLAGLDHLDHLVTTHWHTDHYGGVEGLVKRIRIDHYWDRGLPEPPAADKKAEYPDGPADDDPLGIAYRKASHGKRKALKAGDRLPLKGDVEALVLASGGRVIGARETPSNPACDTSPADLEPDPSDNGRSISLRFRFKAFDFLDSGDMTWNVEKQLVCPVDRIGRIDLYQVTHHGLAISNHPTLLRTIAPTVAVMNNGPRKGGDAAAVNRLRAIPSIKAAYQLHKNAVTPAADNTEAALIANTDPAGGQFIHAEVAPDGRTFTVQIGPDGQARQFPVH
jgi:competence protein ComEC